MCLQIQNSWHLATFSCGDSALEEANRERTGFLIMPKRPYEWRVDSHGRYNFMNADLALGPHDSSAHFPVFLHLRTTNLPGPDSITRSEQAQQRNKDGLNAKPPGTSDGSGDAHEHDVVYQDLLSAYLSTPSTVTSESLVGPLCPLHCCSDILFHVVVCVCVCVSVSVYRSRSSLLDVSSRTILWTAKTLIVSPRHQYKTILVVTHHL